jgi:hypothetical protein
MKNQSSLADKIQYDCGGLFLFVAIQEDQIFVGRWAESLKVI